MQAVIDMRDCAAHHVSASEGNFEGRFMSVGGSWHCNDVFAAFKAAYPEMAAPAEFQGALMTPANYMQYHKDAESGRSHAADGPDHRRTD